MMRNLIKKRGGFTLIEIMIVVAIIGLLASIAVPNYLRARKRGQATRILEDLRVLTGSLDQYAMETNKSGGAAATMADLKNYIKAGTPLYTTSSDVFGNVYGPFTVDSTISVSGSQFNALSDVCDAAFWSPYAVSPY